MPLWNLWRNLDIPFRTHDMGQTADAVASAIMAVQLETPTDPIVELAYCGEKMVLPTRDYSQFWSRADVELKSPTVADAYERELELLRTEAAEAVPAGVQVFRLGRVAVVGLPGMPFGEFVLTIKQTSPAHTTLVACNANDHPGYVITRAALEHGGFESWPARSALIGPGWGEFMADTAVDSLRRLWRKRTMNA